MISVRASQYQNLRSMFIANLDYIVWKSVAVQIHKIGEKLWFSEGEERNNRSASPITMAAIFLSLLAGQALRVLSSLLFVVQEGLVTLMNLL